MLHVLNVRNIFTVDLDSPCRQQNSTLISHCHYLKSHLIIRYSRYLLCKYMYNIYCRLMLILEHHQRDQEREGGILSANKELLSKAQLPLQYKVHAYSYRIAGIFRGMYISRLSTKPGFSRLKFRG